MKVIQFILYYTLGKHKKYRCLTDVCLCQNKTFISVIKALSQGCQMIRESHLEVKTVLSPHPSVSIMTNRWCSSCSSYVGEEQTINDTVKVIGSQWHVGVCGELIPPKTVCVCVKYTQWYVCSFLLQMVLCTMWRPPGKELLSLTWEGKMNQDSDPPFLQIRPQPKRCQG